MQRIILLLLLICTITAVESQSIISPADNLNFNFEPETKSKLSSSLDSLFSQINQAKVKKAFITKKNTELSLSILNGLKGAENEQQYNITDFYKKQLINVYPVAQNEFLISIAYIGHKEDKLPVLKTVFNLIATEQNKQFTFSIPLDHLTKTWKSTTIGHTTYFYPDTFNVDKAKQFEQKNTVIAKKLGLQTEKFNFYLCENYQEILKLLGYEFDAESNGKYRDGYGVDAGTIFSVMKNEDFSHDIVHYYISKIRTAKRNNTVEEGIAYAWGNAYYTDPKGEMLTQAQLVHYLKKQLKENPETSLIELFDKKPAIFNGLAKEVAVKSVLSGLICSEIEKQKGIAGIELLMNCGSGDDNFFKIVNQLIQINRDNFNKSVLDLVNNYK